MRLRFQVAVVTLVLTVAAFIVAPVIWPLSPDIVISEAEVPFFIFLSLVESLSFALGISFLIFGWPLLAKQGVLGDSLRVAMFVSVFWLLVSWWPHDNMHAAAGHDIGALLFLEYAFHFTAMVAAAIVAYGFYKLLEKG